MNVPSRAVRVFSCFAIGLASLGARGADVMEVDPAAAQSPAIAAFIRYRQCLRRSEIDGADVAKRFSDCAAAKAEFANAASASEADEIEARLRAAQAEHKP